MDFLNAGQNISIVESVVFFVVPIQMTCDGWASSVLVK
jgi:hypothetical protein